MTQAKQKQRIEYGDFQTPDVLARSVCARLHTAGIRPDVVVEPTCGIGSFLLAAAESFPRATRIFGFEINPEYLDILHRHIDGHPAAPRVQLQQADFFATDWKTRFEQMPGRILVIGNPPWVTNSAQSSIGGNNLPKKSNFLGHNGFDAISGKANFDISEWMLLEILRKLHGRSADVAMLVKTSVARKVLSCAQRRHDAIYDAFLVCIDAKKNFGVAVDACLLVMRLDPAAKSCEDYTIYANLEADTGKTTSYRYGISISDLDTFENCSFLFGISPKKWRSGIKHDASSVMELTQTPSGYENAIGETVQLEDMYLYPLLKGSDIGNGRAWRNKFMLVTQRNVGEPTALIQRHAPLTWAYLQAHGDRLDARSSIIYTKNPRFSIFGVGDYAFRPWRIAICSLYKELRFRLISPINEKPVMFDDTVYYLSFDAKAEAIETMACLDTEPATGLLSSMIFWDEKRPVKTSILNTLDWSKFAQNTTLRKTTEQLELVWKIRNESQLS
ncbi:MAG: SAM-dependent methyltransferase [Zoogloeaceae bacterium]|nr:SAM-dependent methyltransferase [Zoogloeaceae bacterium]